MKICSWNINSVRLRENLVLSLLKKYSPDIICLQECKALVDDIPIKNFSKIGYKYMIARGQKSYNGVAILSKFPFKNEFSIDFANLDQARHVAGELENGIIIHNFYVPAGGDEPDEVKNLKFAQKLNFLNHMKGWFDLNQSKKAILVGDLNIAPL
jgi:exodeoxyribonuclease-3